MTLNMQVVEAVIRILIELNPLIVKMLLRLLDAGVLAGPLAKLAPFKAEVQMAAELFEKLDKLEMPPHGALLAGAEAPTGDTALAPSK